METKKFLLAAFAAASLITASFSIIFAGSRDEANRLNPLENRMYLLPDSSGDTTDNNGGGPIPPIGH
jgi:hypothetical protein